MLAERVILSGFTAIGLALAAGPAAAETYPTRLIKMIVPFAPGGPADTLARLTVQRLSMVLGQSVVIDNRPGAGGTIGAKAVANSDPDGYTLLFGNTATFVIGPTVYANAGYDPFKQLAPVALVSLSFNVLVVNPAFSAKSVPQLIAYAKSNPGKVNFASPGHGTPPHMIGEMLKQRAGIDIVHVPYKGTAAALTDIMSGQMDMTFENPSVSIPLIQAGKLKGLAVTGETRNMRVPDLPTMIESGLADFVSMSFTGVAAPAGVPASVVGTLNAAINEGLNSTDMQDSFAKLGVETKIGSAEDFSAFVAKEKDKWAAVARAANIRVD